MHIQAVLFDGFDPLDAIAPVQRDSSTAAVRPAPGGRSHPLMNLVSPVIVGIIYCLLMSLIKEPHRRHFNAIMVGGAGAAYLSGGGFGPWELPFVALTAYVAYRGLDSWSFIGVGWLLHTAWDTAHHLKGNPILPFHHDASLACAICDPVIALWCFRGGPSLIALVRRRFQPGRTADHAHDHVSAPRLLRRPGPRKQMRVCGR